MPDAASPTPSAGPEPSGRGPALRLAGAVAMALALVVVGLTLPGGEVEAEAPDLRTVADDGHDHDDGHGHDHADPATKNAISRSLDGPETAETADPTTPEQAALARRVVALQRAEAEPAVEPGSAGNPRLSSPQDRYAMAGGCYALRAPNGRWVRRVGDTLVAGAARPADAEPFRFQATDLGSYLLYGTKRDFVARNGDAVTMAGKASKDADFTATRAGRGFRLGIAGRRITVRADGVLAMGDGSTIELRAVGGCARFPEAEVNVSGAPHRGQSPYQGVTGYVDAHTHQMAYEFLGGRAHCGRPWHRFGAPKALVDCFDHTVTGGYGAVLEAFLSGNPSHDPVGWPTFKDWPAPDSLTHEGTYHKWMERAWRGGLRLFVNLLVENNKLCELYPLKKNSCDDMDSVRLQAKRMYQFQDYVDAQFGGPGKGWYRIVKNPVQARRVINAGKLAVIMGIETSVPFGCTMKADIPQCSKAEIDRQLDEMHALGVRQMELVNKFDNALSGVAGDAGETGLFVGGANFLETGTFWQMEQCTYDDPEVSDKTQSLAPPSPGQQDALFGAIAKLLPIQPAPVYAAAPHCNKRGLTDLGQHTIRGLAKRKMLFDPDHMSVRARKSSMDLIEEMDYSGVLSSHSWSTPDAYPRIAKAGGFIAPYAGDSTGFVQKWRRHQTWADQRYLFGLGFGADINGLGAQGNPRGADAENKVTYPFQGLGGVTVRKQRSGKRVYDINTDGVAHYGLYPDWIEDLRRLAGDAIVEDMARGAEAYLQMWERATGISNDGCRDRASRTPLRAFERLDPGVGVPRLLQRVGQPHVRTAEAFRYCAKRPNGRTAKVVVELTRSGKVARVRT